jgi:hypothetical protein
MHNEKGNVVFLILIAVALFAALSFAATQTSGGGGGGDAAKETRIMKASQATQYMTAIETTMMKMRISKGCAEDEMSFHMVGVPELVPYLHTPDVDDKCKVFHPLGGGVPWAPPPDDINDGTQWVFTGANLIKDVGTNNGGDPVSAELIAVLPNVNRDFCIDMNRKLGVPGASPPVDLGTYDVTEFDGNFTAGDEIEGAPGSEILNGLLSGCFESQASAGTYHYFHVLEQR